MDKKELKTILEQHKLWLDGDPQGKRAEFTEADLTGANLKNADLRHADFSEANLIGANLEGANLRLAYLQFANLRFANLKKANIREAFLEHTILEGTDLRGADLRGASLDFSCWPLWCGSLDIKVDKKIAVQLAYHFCALDCKNKEFKKARKKLLKFANQIHRTDVKELV